MIDLWLAIILVASLIPLGFAAYALLRRRWLNSVLLALLAVLVAIGIPVINMEVFSHRAERYREQMLATARAEGCVGRSTEWLQTRFGKPLRIHHKGQAEHWWYTPPAPWYIIPWLH